MNGYVKTKNFECKKGLYRFFRIIQTEKGFADEWGFGLRQIELFGTFYESNYVPFFYPCSNAKCSSHLLKHAIFLDVIICSM